MGGKNVSIHKGGENVGGENERWTKKIGWTLSRGYYGCSRENDLLNALI